jgi:rare lipoprotein A
VPSTTRPTFAVQAPTEESVTPDPPAEPVVLPDPELIAAAPDESVAWPSGSRCTATWYGPGFEGKPTANGETFDPTAFTAALHDVPFNTIVKVTRIDTGAVTTVRVNDRGPYEWDGGWRRHPTRCIDLSEASMAALGGIEDGVILVRIKY